MNTKLDEMIRGLLQEKKGDWQAIALASGVSYSWLSKFVNGHIPNPGYTTLMRLHGHLIPEDLTKSAANQGQGATQTAASGA